LEKQGSDCRWQWNEPGCCHGNHQSCVLSNKNRCLTGKTLGNVQMKCKFIEDGESVKLNHYRYTCSHRRRVQNCHMTSDTTARGCNINDPINQAEEDPFNKKDDGCKCTQNDAQSCDYRMCSNAQLDYVCDHNGCKPAR
jgi:hypothetical protein